MSKIVTILNILCGLSVNILSLICLVNVIINYSFLIRKNKIRTIGEEIKYEDLKKITKTFDLILCKGTGYDSFSIQGWSNSVFTHVGIIVKIENSGELLIFHSDVNNQRKNVINGEYQSGVQINRLSKFIELYKGDIYYCPLLSSRTELSNRNNEEEMENKLYTFMDKNLGKYFNNNIIDMLRCTYGKGGGWIGNKKQQLQVQQNKESYFCSELISDLFKHVGIFKQSTKSEEIHPKIFAYTSINKMYYNDNYSSGEILIKIKKK